MDDKIEKELVSFFQESILEHVKDMHPEEVKCLDWFVLDADPYIEAKNKKVA